MPLNGLSLVAELHNKIRHDLETQGLDVVHNCPPPAHLTERVAQLRINLISEELGELLVAYVTDDAVEVADALGDLAYVLYGTAEMAGAPLTLGLSNQSATLSPAEAIGEVVHAVRQVILTTRATPDNVGRTLSLGSLLTWAIETINTAAAAFEVPIEQVFTEVHSSNCTKTWPDGMFHFREDGKWLKPPTYRPADVAGVLAAHA